MERRFQLQVSDLVVGEKGSARKAFFNFFKSMFGAGILTFANAFSHVGLGLGVPTFILCYVTICIATYMLLDCYRIATMLTGREVRGYDDVAGFVFGPRGKKAMQHALIALQILLCTGFLIAYADNMVEVLPELSRRAIVAIAFPALVAMSWISSLRDMWFVSVLGLAVYLLGVLLLSTYDGVAHYREPEDLAKYQLRGLGHFLGVSSYAFEGIGLILPTVSSMKRPARAPAVVFSGLSLYAAIALIFGAFSYAAGLGSCDIITSCVDRGLPATGVRVALSVALLLTYPVYILVPARILEHRLRLRGRSTHHLVPVWAGEAETETQSVDHSVASGLSGAGSAARVSRGSTPERSLGSWRTRKPLSVLLLRLVLVGGTCLVAASGIRASTFTVLVGAALTTLVAFIVPALMWWRMYALLQRLSADGSDTFGTSTHTAPLLPKEGTTLTTTRNKDDIETSSLLFAARDSESTVTTSSTTNTISARSAYAVSTGRRGQVGGGCMDAWFEDFLPGFGSRRLPVPPLRTIQEEPEQSAEIPDPQEDEYIPVETEEVGGSEAVPGYPPGYRIAPLSWRGRAMALGALAVGGTAMLTGVVEASGHLLHR
jgi:hypothetical protein